MWGLLTRAWLCASTLSIPRLYGMFTKSIPWFQEETLCDGSEFTKCYRPYNAEFLDKTADAARIVVQVTLIITIIICLICFKWRSAASAFIYLEIIVQLATMFYPNSNRSFASTYLICIEYGTYFLVYYCGSMRSFYFIMIAMTFAIFFNSHVAYNEPFTAGAIGFKISSALVGVIVATFIVTGIDILAILHHKLQLSNKENIRMLDGMHEGLLVLNKAKNSN